MTSLNYLGKEVKNGYIITDNSIGFSRRVRDFSYCLIAGISDNSFANGRICKADINPDTLKVIVFKGKADYMA